MNTDFTQEILVLQDVLAYAQVNLAGNMRAMTTIHERIKELREKRGLTMEAVGELVGVSWQTVQQWENGSTAPRRNRIPRVADALNTTPEYLLFGEPKASSEGQTMPPARSEANAEKASVHPLPLRYDVSAKNFRRVYALGRAQGGLPERIWTDGDYPVGATDEYAEIATSDPHAFLVPVVDVSMVPRFNPGEFAFVEPGTAPEAGDDVLVRLATGETMIKKLVSQRAGMTELESYNKAAQGTLFFPVEEITWMYYIAHPVPARKIKTRM
jgi:phage repressor protein C with HTH and peptisase S24 domain